MKERKRYISDKTSRIVSIAITVCFILAYITYFEIYLKFPDLIHPLYSIAVFLVPNAVLLLAKFVIMACITTRKMLYEFKSLLISLSLYIPFILCEFEGGTNDFSNYIITFTSLVFLWMLIDIKKKKRIELTSILLLLLPPIILFNYFTMGNYITHENWGVIQYGSKLIVNLINIAVCVISLIKAKLNLKKLVIAILFTAAVLTALNFITADLYLKYACTAISLIILLCIQIPLKNKFIINNSFVLYALITAISAFSIYRDTCLLQEDFTRIISYTSLTCASLFSVLILLEKHIIERRMI